jgi:hypothetical protein
MKALGWPAFIFILIVAFGFFIGTINTGVDAPSYLVKIDDKKGRFSVQFQGVVITHTLLDVNWDKIPKNEEYIRLINKIDRENIQWNLDGDKLRLWYYDINQVRHDLNEELLALYKKK